MSTDEVHDRPPTDRGRPGSEIAVMSRIFFAIGIAVAVMSVIYLLTADYTGQIMLSVAALLSLVCGTFLWLELRTVQTSTAEDGPSATGMYLPHASIWPFAIGVAGFLFTNGLILGVWFLVPGTVLLVAGVIGFARQSRRRD